MRSGPLLWLLLCGVSVQSLPLFLSQESGQIEAVPNGEGQTQDVKRNFWSSIWAAFVMIMATELGDKTFIIAAVLAGKKPRLAIFLGVVITMTFMSVISSMIGITFVTFIDQFYLNIAASLLFLLFSVLSFKEACSEDDDCDESSIESSLTQGDSNSTWLWALWQCMGLIFCAEWGDKSQLGTVTLVAQCNAYGVVLGAFIGVVVCAAIAVLGGRWIAGFLSEKTMAYIAGVIFLVFAVLTIVLA